MTGLLFKLISLLPLPALHICGGWLGLLAGLFGRRYRLKLRANLEQAGLYSEELYRESLRHSGMQALEMAWVWNRKTEELLPYCSISEQVGADLAAAVTEGRPIVFMTPHLGCYEVSPLCVYERFLKQLGKKMVIMYRPPSQPFIQGLVAKGRRREGIEPVAATMGGVRQVMRALREGVTFGCLPDQVPRNGEGMWAPFFGRPAYTMTMAMKLIEHLDAIVFMAWTTRRPGVGWRINVRRWPITERFASPEEALTAMNREIEKIILLAPEQYIWSYNRFRVPAGVRKPTAAQIERARAVYAESR